MESDACRGRRKGTKESYERKRQKQKTVSAWHYLFTLLPANLKIKKKMVVDKIKELATTLENQELECATTGSQVSTPCYTQLLAIYLYQNDLCNAKYLWKRIPKSVKTSSNELQNVWAVGKKMWQRDFSGVYQALSETWSCEISEIMDALKDKVRQRAVNLVSTAYSSINLETLADFTGLSVEEAHNHAVAAGWTVDEDSKIVHPCKAAPSPAQGLSCEEQLSKLTHFVSFLEN